MINYSWAGLSLTLIWIGLLGDPVAATPDQTHRSAPQSTGQRLSQLPAPPTTPPPNRTRSGGSLNATAICGDVTEPLIALIPVENPVLTQSPHPTVLLYVPYAASEVRLGEFSVLVGLDELTRLYHTRFTLPETPGIVSISLPDQPNYALTEGELYHWYVKLYCADNVDATADLEVDGWVQRVADPVAVEPETPLALPTAWYDTLATVRDRLQANPNDAALQQQWRSLLTLIELEDLADAPYGGEVLPLD